MRAAPTTFTREPARITASFFVLLLLGSLALRLPGLMPRLVDRDEAAIATVAMVIDHGGKLYEDVADRKPPVVPYLYATLNRVTGAADLRADRIAAGVAMAASAFLLATEALRRTRNRKAATVCGLLFVVASVSFFPRDFQAANFEHFMLLPLIGAVVVAGRGRAGAAGVLLAVATLVKQPAITTALPVAYLVYRSGGMRGLLRAGAGAGGVLVGALAVFGPGNLWLWTIVASGGYLEPTGSLWFLALRFLVMTGVFVGANVALLWLARRAVGAGRVSPDVWLWLLSAALGVTAGFRFFGHYYLQLLPPLVLMASLAVPEVDVRHVRRAVAAAAVIATGFVVASLFSAGSTTGYEHLAAQVRAMTAPDQTIFVWGRAPELYWATQRRPGSRFIHTGFLTGESGGRAPSRDSAGEGLPGGWRMLADDLARYRPALLIDTTHSTTSPGGERLRLEDAPVWPTLKGKYQRLFTEDGAVFYTRVGAAGRAPQERWAWPGPR